MFTLFLDAAGRERMIVDKVLFPAKTERGGGECFFPPYTAYLASESGLLFTNNATICVVEDPLETRACSLFRRSGFGKAATILLFIQHRRLYSHYTGRKKEEF